MESWEIDLDRHMTQCESYEMAYEAAFSEAVSDFSYSKRRFEVFEYVVCSDHILTKADWADWDSRESIDSLLTHFSFAERAEMYRKAKEYLIEYDLDGLDTDDLRVVGGLYE